MREPSPKTARAAWICRCVWRLKRLYGNGDVLPGADRGLTWSEYARLVACVLAAEKLLAPEPVATMPIEEEGEDPLM